MKNARPAKKGKGYIRIAIIAIMLVLTVKALLGVRSNAIETVLLEYGEVKIMEQAKGVVVRMEKTVKAPISGRIAYIVPENVKVPVGTKVLEIKRDRIDDETLARYNEINKRIQALGDLDSEAAPDNSTGNVMKYLANISRLIHEGSLLAVYYEKEHLVRELNRSTALASSANELKLLLQEKDKIEKEMDGGVKAEYTQFPAVPVYALDGYEEVLTVESIKEINPAELSPPAVLRIDLNKGVEAGETVLKLVDNRKWYIVSQLSSGFGEDIKENKNVSIEFPGDDTVTVKGRVIGSKTTDQGTVVYIEIKDYVPGIFEQRFVDIILIKERYSGFVVPQKAIIEKGNETEVLVLQEGKVRSKKVAVKASDGINAVVESVQNGPALKLYDQVIINWERFGGNEGEY
ncbi:MAG: hypothetical protein HPY66_0160 [Firmicutes bacterium]|nr:hypothetical protein [Bacillota bacterium]